MSTVQVLIGCKLPHGLVMELVKPHPIPTSNAPAPPGRRVKLNGANSARLVAANIQDINSVKNPAEHAYGITSVDAEFAEAWFVANADADFVKRGFVFKAADKKEFEGEVKDRRGDATLRTDFEPLDVLNGDRRMQHGIEPDKDQLKRFGII